MSRDSQTDKYCLLVDNLTEDTLQEAADHFFGQRRRLEEALQDYQGKVEVLRQIDHELQVRLANLHFLLRRGQVQTIREFYLRLEVDPDQVPWPSPGIGPDLSLLTLPWALRPKGRYQKVLRLAYVAVVDKAYSYMYGRYCNDPKEPRCKRITVNYSLLQKICERLGNEVNRTNQFNTPSQVLQFSKQLNIDQAEKESLAGVPTQYSLDQQLAFEVPDFTCARLNHYPDFPDPDKVEDQIRQFTTKVWVQAEKEVRSILQTVKEASGY